MPCLRCHACGAPIAHVLDGEEWCSACHTYQRPRSHGWASDDYSPCRLPGGAGAGR